MGTGVAVATQNCLVFNAEIPHLGYARQYGVASHGQVAVELAGAGHCQVALERAGADHTQGTADLGIVGDVQFGVDDHIPRKIGGGGIQRSSGNAQAASTITSPEK